MGYRWNRCCQTTAQTRNDSSLQQRLLLTMIVVVAAINEAERLLLRGTKHGVIRVVTFALLRTVTIS